MSDQPSPAERAAAAADDPCTRLAIAAADVLLQVSERNWRDGHSGTKHLIYRPRLRALADALDAAYPGYMDRVRERERRAAREAT
jgi:hypothetical protein